MWFIRTFTCFLLFSFRYASSAQIPSFLAPDSVCINSPVSIANTSVGGTTYFWSFCDADLNQIPVGDNLGDISGILSQPVFIDIISQNNNYYGLLINHYPGALLRLDFGNSLLNTPVATDLGNFGGIINAGFGTEGIQVVNNNGNWYALIVGGDPLSESNPEIVQVNFGPNITNPAPVATNWGNLGNLKQPIGFYVFNENNNWYGFTVNATNNTITRFDFGNSFDVPPNATNLGNPGNLFDYPTNLCPLKNAATGNWSVFITNGTPGSPNTLERLDFGASLLNNTPNAVSLGNPGNVIQTARDIKIIQQCDQTIGFVADGTTNALVKLDFNNNILSVPTAGSLGNIGNFDYPHSLSKLFRVGADLYTFIPNLDNNTLTRVRFSGCMNASIPNSTLQSPPVVSYSQPGTYHINLIMDDGLSTQSSFCQTIVVGSLAAFSLGNDTTLCMGDSVVLNYPSNPALTYTWQDGSTANTYTVTNTGKYKLTLSNTEGCMAADSMNVSVIMLPTVSIRPDTNICSGTSVQLTTLVQNDDSVLWTPATGLSSPVAVSPVATPLTSTRYIITTYRQNCSVEDTIMVNVLINPVLTINPDTLVCIGSTVQLQVSGANSYLWYPQQGISDPTIADPLATPDSSVRFHVVATGANSCTTADSVLVTLKQPATFIINPKIAGICIGDSVLISVKGSDGSPGDSYQWIADIGQQDSGSSDVVVSPAATSSYEVIGTDTLCKTRDTLTALINVLPRPSVTVSKSNDIGCVLGQATLTATGGVSYRWEPIQTLTDPNSANPVASTDTTTTYQVLVKGEDGCVTIDSITVTVTKGSGSIGYPVANAFTPNGDGKNDCFGIKYWGYIGEFEISVFNRWGQRVFYGRNPDQCWDGTYGGHPEPAGTYVYVIKAFTLCGEAVKNGTVELIR
jgi:gliding motility-associated-like protein